MIEQYYMIKEHCRKVRLFAREPQARLQVYVCIMLISVALTRAGAGDASFRQSHHDSQRALQIRAQASCSSSAAFWTGHVAAFGRVSVEE